MELNILRTGSLIYLITFSTCLSEAKSCITEIPNVTLTDSSGELDSCHGNPGTVCYYECGTGYEENPAFPSLMCDNDGHWNASTEHLCFNTTEIDQFCSYLGGTWTKVLIGGVLGAGVLVAIPTILALIGFGPGGVVAGSLAAAWMAKIGAVTAGSLYAFLQSLAMGGISVFGQASIVGVIQIIFQWLLGQRCSGDYSNNYGRNCDMSIQNGYFVDSCVPKIGSACTYYCNFGYSKTYYVAKCLSNLQWNIIESGGQFCVR